MAQGNPFANAVPSDAPHTPRGGPQQLPPNLLPGNASLALVERGGALPVPPPVGVGLLASEPQPFYGHAMSTAAAQSNPTQPSFEANGQLLQLTTSAASSKKLAAAQLYGCPNMDYSALTVVGGQKFYAIADTGSSIFGVASDQCGGCDLSPEYKLSNTAIDSGQQFESAYGSGSFVAEEVQDAVTFAGGLSTQVIFGDILEQKGFFTANNCVLGQQGPPINEAIMGLAGKTLLLADTTSYFLSIANELPAPAYAFGLCDLNGVMYLGGYPSANVDGKVLYTPMAQSDYIAVAMTGLAVGKQDIGATLDDFGYTIVDTGTTDLVFPPDVYAAVASGISDATNGQLTQAFFDQGTCVQLHNTTASDINAAVPPLTFSFYNGDNGAFTYTTDATNSYLILRNDANGNLVACPGMVSSGDNPQTIFGNTAMRNFMVVFDFGNAQVGFGLSKGICKTS